MPTSRMTTSGSRRRKTASAATSDASKYDSVTGPSAAAMSSNTSTSSASPASDAVEANPLVEAPQVRRRERADVVARVPIDALEHRDARALAVRAGDRHDLVRAACAGRAVSSTAMNRSRRRSMRFGWTVSNQASQRSSVSPRCGVVTRSAPPGSGQARAASRASPAAPRSDRASGGDRGSCRWRPSRAGTRRAGILRAASRPSSAR